MNCHDARQGFSALFHGGMRLTEWALLEPHVRQCVECSKGRESVQEVVNARQQATPSRARLHGVSKIIDTRLVGPLTRAHRQLPQLFPYSPLTIAGQGAARAAIGAAHSRVT